MPSENSASERAEAPDPNDAVDMTLHAERERRWIVLYDEDYTDVMLDANDSVAILVDNNQACEVLRLANMAVADLAPETAPDTEPIRALNEQLEEVADE